MNSLQMTRNWMFLHWLWTVSHWFLGLKSVILPDEFTDPWRSAASWYYAAKCYLRKWTESKHYKDVCFEDNSFAFLTAYLGSLSKCAVTY
jgi:hypothetical protein